MIAKEKKVIILLASCNGGSYIKEQLDSILKQQSVYVTICVSDDVSVDETVRIIEGYNNSSIRLHSNSKRSGSAGKNFMQMIATVDCSQHDYVAFSDQDDIWNPDKLIVGITEIEAFDADAYSSNVLAFWDSGKTKLINKAQPQRRSDYLFEAAGPGCTYIIKASIVQEIKLFLANQKIDLDSIWLHDWFVYAYLRSKGYKWIIDERPGLLYRQHQSNQVGVNEGFLAMKARAKLALEGKYLNQVRKLKEILGETGCKYLEGDLNFSKRLAFIFDIRSCRRRFRDRFALAFWVATGLVK